MQFAIVLKPKCFLHIFYIIIKSKLRNTLHFYQISMFVCVVTILIGMNNLHVAFTHSYISNVCLSQVRNEVWQSKRIPAKL